VNPLKYIFPSDQYVDEIYVYYTLIECNLGASVYANFKCTVNLQLLNAHNIYFVVKYKKNLRGVFNNEPFIFKLNSKSTCSNVKINRVKCIFNFYGCKNCLLCIFKTWLTRAIMTSVLIMIFLHQPNIIYNFYFTPIHHILLNSQIIDINMYEYTMIKINIFVRVLI